MKLNLKKYFNIICNLLIFVLNQGDSLYCWIIRIEMLKQDFFFIRLNLNIHSKSQFFRSIFSIRNCLHINRRIHHYYVLRYEFVATLYRHCSSCCSYNEARWKALCLSKQKACAEVFIADELLSLLSSWLSVRQPSGKRNATKREECRFALFLSRPQDFSVSGRFTSTIGKKRKNKALL